MDFCWRECKEVEFKEINWENKNILRDSRQRRMAVHGLEVQDLQVAYTLFHEDPLPTKQIASYLVHSLRACLLPKKVNFSL